MSRRDMLFGCDPGPDGWCCSTLLPNAQAETCIYPIGPTIEDRRRRSMKNTLITAALMAALASGAALAQSSAPADSSTPQTQPPAQSSQPQAAPPPHAPPPPAQPPAAAPAGANQAQAPSTPRIAPGSVIPVQLTRTIDAKKA